MITNVLSLIISLILILLIPKYYSESNYGYYQLYLFYLSYLGFLQFGLNDGIYLKNVGVAFTDLVRMKQQFIILFISQLLISLISFIFISNLVKEQNKYYIFSYLCIALLIMASKTLFLFIFQTTNKIKEYAIATLLEKVVFLILVVVPIFFVENNFNYLVICDLISKMISLIVCIYFSRMILSGSFQINKNDIFTSLDNIKVGIFLMFSNISSMLIIGVIRFGIEKNYSIETFGKISLMLTSTTFLMLFVSAVSLVFFPYIKHYEKEIKNILCKLPYVYLPVLSLILLMVYPINFAIKFWLPNYINVLHLLLLLFPMIYFEAKFALFISNTLKVVRQEKILMKVNFFILILSAFITFINSKMFNSLEFSVLSIVIMLALRTNVLHSILQKKLEVKTNNFLEYLVIILYYISLTARKEYIGFLMLFIGTLIIIFIGKTLKRDK